MSFELILIIYFYYRSPDCFRRNPRRQDLRNGTGNDSEYEQSGGHPLSKG